MDIKVSHLEKTQYLPKTDKKEQIITHPDGLVISKGRMIGIVEIEGVIDPKKLAGDIFATDAALGNEKQKDNRPFLVVAVKKIGKIQKKKLNYIIEYAKEKQRCKYLADNIELCTVDDMEKKIKEATQKQKAEK